jgi:hypothetical protein
MQAIYNSNIELDTFYSTFRVYKDRIKVAADKMDKPCFCAYYDINENQTQRPPEWVHTVDDALN